jgi:TolA-binding protein
MGTSISPRRRAFSKHENRADANVQFAKRCLKREEVDKGKQRLAEVIKEYPGTKAAEEAAKLLKEFESKKD